MKRIFIFISVIMMFCGIEASVDERVTLGKTPSVDYSPDNMCEEIFSLCDFYVNELPVTEYSDGKGNYYCLPMAISSAWYAASESDGHAGINAYALFLAGIIKPSDTVSESIADSVYKYFSSHPDELYFLYYLITQIKDEYREWMKSEICKSIVWDIIYADYGFDDKNPATKHMERMETVYPDFIRFFNLCGMPLKIKGETLVLGDSVVVI